MISMARMARTQGRRGAAGVTETDAPGGSVRPAITTPSVAATAPVILAGDLMEGAEEIAEFMFGDRSEKSVRKVFYLASEVKVENRPPIFKLGKAKLAARRSRLLAWVEACETAASA